MERDFLGLNWKDSKMLRQNSNGTCANSVAGFPWPFSRNVYSPPQSMDLKATPEDKHRDFAHSSLASLCSPVSSTGYAFDPATKPPFPENLAAPTMKQLPLGGTSFVEPPCISPNNGFENCSTYSRNNAIASEQTSQLTIFYADAVHIYHDISPEKAEVVMVMAGNGSRTNADSREISRPVSEDVHSNPPQPPHVLYPGQDSSGAFTERITTVPDARKATLTRFLEKRKNRCKEL